MNINGFKADDFIELTFESPASIDKTIFSNKIFNNKIIQNRAKTAKPKDNQRDNQMDNYKENLRDTKDYANHPFNLNTTGSTIPTKQLITSKNNNNILTTTSNQYEKSKFITIKEDEKIKKPNKNTCFTLDQIFRLNSNIDNKTDCKFLGEKITYNDASKNISIAERPSNFSAEPQKAISVSNKAK